MTVNQINWSEKKVLVAGGGGFLGSHVVNELKNLNVKDVSTPASKDYDLRNRTDCKKVLKDIDVVFHLASTSGGIMFLTFFWYYNFISNYVIKIIST